MDDPRLGLDEKTGEQWYREHKAKIDREIDAKYLARTQRRARVARNVNVAGQLGFAGITVLDAVFLGWWWFYLPLAAVNVFGALTTWWWFPIPKESR